MIQSLGWGPIPGSDKSCIVAAAGGKGKITANYCPVSLNSGQTANITLTCKNTDTASVTFALMFCASSPPYTLCDVAQYLSDAFVLEPGLTMDIAIPITMPNNQVLYVATLQHTDGISWATDDTAVCSISLPAPPTAQNDTQGISAGTVLGVTFLVMASLGIIMSIRKKG